MKNFNFLFNVLLFSFLSSTAFAQDYVVTHRNDTLRGKIKMYNSGVDRKVQVSTADKKKTSVPVFQVKSITLDNNIYHPVKRASGYEFMKLVKSGYLSIYAYQMPSQSTFDGMLLTKRDGTSLEVPNLNFKKSMKKYLEECPETAAKIDDGTLARKDLHLIVDHYNECIHNNTEKSAPQSEQPPVSSTLQVPDNATATLSAWTQLAERVKALDDFAGRSDALDMITEINAKLSRREKVPNFLIEGLKGSLKEKGVDEELNTALAEIK